MELYLFSFLLQDSLSALFGIQFLFDRGINLRDRITVFSIVGGRARTVPSGPALRPSFPTIVGLPQSLSAAARCSCQAVTANTHLPPALSDRGPAGIINKDGVDRLDSNLDIKWLWM